MLYIHVVMMNATISICTTIFDPSSLIDLSHCSLAPEPPLLSKDMEIELLDGDSNSDEPHTQHHLKMVKATAPPVHPGCHSI